MSRTAVKVKSLTWTCEVCHVTLTSLYPKQLASNRGEHERSKRHINRTAKALLADDIELA